MANLIESSFNVNIPDVGTAVTLCIPVTPANKGKITRITTCLGAAISGADSKVVVSRNATVLGTITIANSSSAAGDIDYLDVFAASTDLVVGDFITVANGGESTGTATGVITFDLKR